MVINLEINFCNAREREREGERKPVGRRRGPRVNSKIFNFLTFISQNLENFLIKINCALNLNLLINSYSNKLNYLKSQAINMNSNFTKVFRIKCCA